MQIHTNYDFVEFFTNILILKNINMSLKSFFKPIKNIKNICFILCKMHVPKFKLLASFAQKRFYISI